MTIGARTHHVSSLPLPKEQEEWLKSTVRDVPDFPKPGIIFKDLTTLMKDATAFKLVLNALTMTAPVHKMVKPLTLPSMPISIILAAVNGCN